MMTEANEEVDSTLDDLFARANQEHDTVLYLVKRGLHHARIAGEALMKAKEIVVRGQWESYLERYFKGSKETARVYMRIAERWDEIEANGGIDTIQQARNLLAKPQKKRPPLMEGDDPPEEEEVPVLTMKSSEVDRFHDAVEFLKEELGTRSMDETIETVVLYAEEDLKRVI